MKTISTFVFLFLLIVFSIDVFTQHFDVPGSMSENLDFFVIPPEYSLVGGPATFTGPLASTSRTIQFLIHDTLLTAMIGKEIKGITWRLPGSATSNWPTADAVYTDYSIFLSGSVPPSQRSLTFANNVVAPQSLVRSGALTIPAGLFSSGKVPNDWGPDILLDSIWEYKGGHLLIELRTSTSTGTSRSVDAIGTSGAGYGTLFSACWASGSTATSGSQGNFTILRLSADVPIPVELVSFSAATIGNDVELLWSTATETNNSGFEIQRKSSTSDFRQIGFISGAGTTTELSNYSFTDYKLPAGKYSYRLKQLDFDGTYEFSNEVEVDVINVTDFILTQNYPNPFNPNTTINFQLPVTINVNLKVYDVLGNEIVTLVNEEKPAGSYDVQFSIDGFQLSSGVYYYKLQAGSFIEIKKMILLK